MLQNLDWYTIGSIIGVLGAVIGGLCGFKAGKKNGINVEEKVSVAKDVVDVAGQAIDVADRLAPNNKAIDILQEIVKWAKIGVGNAEQLAHSDQVQDSERKQIAEKVVYDTLKELNVEVTPERQNLINAAIENAVKDLGHTPQDVKKLNEEKIQLQDENEELKNKVATIQATVSNK